MLVVTDIGAALNNLGPESVSQIPHKSADCIILVLCDNHSCPGCGANVSIIIKWKIDFTLAEPSVIHKTKTHIEIPDDSNCVQLQSCFSRPMNTMGTCDCTLIIQYTYRDGTSRNQR